MNASQEIIQRIVDKLATEKLDERFANNLFPTVPTDASKFIGLDMMQEKNIDSKSIKYTAFEPTKGKMRSVVSGTKAPIIDKRGFRTEEHKNINFKEAVLFDETDWTAIMQAQAADARDAEKRFAAETVFRAVEQLKFRDLTVRESLFWDGTQGTMTVPQLNNGVFNDFTISTGTRTIAALTGNDVWDDVSSSSTADVLRDLQTMNESFTGKGTRLEKIKCNLVTFNTMLRVPALRDRLKESEFAKLIELQMNISFMVGGILVEVYDEGYIDEDTDTFTNFIPDGVIVGFGRNSDMLDGQAVQYLKGINPYVQASPEFRDGLATAAIVHGEFLNMNTEVDPLSSKLILTNVGLPAFINPQFIVSQTVFT